MTTGALIFLLFYVAGGLALFVFGMNVMAEGLRMAAGPSLRKRLSKATQSPLTGYALGTGLGTLVHSSAATVMVVGFCNAGLIRLAAAIPPVLGANLGTTFSMQLVSLKLGDYCYVMITVGLLLSLVSRAPTLKQYGRALLGFGLLFLGMTTMSGAIAPHRAALAPYLQAIDGTTLHGTLLGIGLSTLLTAIWQSSGATVAMCFALISAGVFTSLEQVFPLVMGAQLGTCATALLGSIGTNIVARRAAVSHLVFNIVAVSIALLLRKYYLAFIPFTAEGLVHQTANLHTVVQFLSTLVVLPFARPFSHVIEFLVRTRGKAPELSHLNSDLQQKPELAVHQAILELQRVMKICVASYHRLARIVLLEAAPKAVRTIRMNEKAINEVKTELKQFVSSLASISLSRRQVLLVQYVSSFMTDIERIGDHIDEICDISLRRKRAAQSGLVDRTLLDILFKAYREAGLVLDLIVSSFAPEDGKAAEIAAGILEARKRYFEYSAEAKKSLSHAIAEHEIAPTAALFYRDYILALDRILKHAKAIAMLEQKPDFVIKHSKLDAPAGTPRTYPTPESVDPESFLRELHMEDYL